MEPSRRRELRRISRHTKHARGVDGRRGSRSPGSSITPQLLAVLAPHVEPTLETTVHLQTNSHDRTTRQCRASQPDWVYEATEFQWAGPFPALSRRLCEDGWQGWCRLVGLLALDDPLSRAAPDQSERRGRSSIRDAVDGVTSTSNITRSPGMRGRGRPAAFFYGT